MERKGLSLIETLVTIGIIGLLIALLLPAIQSSREAARRIACTSNLKQLGIGLNNYESTWHVFPSGMAHKYQLLPFIEQKEIFQLGAGPVDPSNSIAKWRPIQGIVISLYVCPTESVQHTFQDAPNTLAATSYGGCFGTGFQKYGYNGIFNLGFNIGQIRGGYVSAAGIKDGLSNTAAMAEIAHSSGGKSAIDRLRVNWFTPTPMIAPDQLDAFAAVCEAIPPDPTSFGWNGSEGERGVPWYNGGPGKSMYNHVLPPNRPSCRNGTGDVHRGVYTAASMHPGGVGIMFADGHVAFIGNSIDRNVWRKMGSIAGDSDGMTP